MRLCRCHKELYVANLEVLILLQDPQAHLEKGHQKGIEKQFVLNLFGLWVFEVIHDGL